MAGRKPTPTALKLVKGNPGKRPLNTNEPEYKNTIPKCPMKLDSVGSAEWKSKSKLLHESGVLTEIDGNTLAIYCHIWSQIIILTSEINKASDYMAYDIKVNEDTGEEIKVNAKTNPLAVRLESLYSEYRAYSAILGLDPVNRGRIKTAKPKDKAKPEGKERFFG